MKEVRWHLEDFLIYIINVKFKLLAKCKGQELHPTDQLVSTPSWHPWSPTACCKALAGQGALLQSASSSELEIYKRFKVQMIWDSCWTLSYPYWPIKFESKVLNSCQHQVAPWLCFSRGWSLHPVQPVPVLPWDQNSVRRTAFCFSAAFWTKIRSLITILLQTHFKKVFRAFFDCWAVSLHAGITDQHHGCSNRLKRTVEPNLNSVNASVTKLWIFSADPVKGQCTTK